MDAEKITSLLNDRGYVVSHNGIFIKLVLEDLSTTDFMPWTNVRRILMIRTKKYVTLQPVIVDKSMLHTIRFSCEADTIPGSRNNWYRFLENFCSNK